jgi:hypothetical protein
MNDEQSEVTVAGQTPVQTFAPVPLVAPPVPERARFSRRFLVTYIALGLVFAGSLSALVAFGVRPGFGHQPWSTWKPHPGSVAAMAKEIADHVAPKYRLPKGAQLVAVVPSVPAVTAGTANIAIAAVAFRSSAQGTVDVQPMTPGKTEMYTLCGLGNHCSIASGKPSLMRGRLVHREGLETALYSFKYIPALESVILFMPPAKGATVTTVLYYQKESLSGLLKQPLRRTLPLAIPPRSNQDDLVEGPTIDALTLPHLYTSTLTQLQGGGALLVLSQLA